MFFLLLNMLKCSAFFYKCANIQYFCCCCLPFWWISTNKLSKIKPDLHLCARVWAWSSLDNGESLACHITSPFNIFVMQFFNFVLKNNPAYCWMEKLGIWRASDSSLSKDLRDLSILFLFIRLTNEPKIYCHWMEKQKRLLPKTSIISIF